MRVLFTTQVGAGHWRPLAPFAQALALAGHEVAFVGTSFFCAEIGGYGFRAFPAGVDDWLVAPSPPRQAPVAAPAQAASVLRDVFLPNAERRLPEMLAIARDWRPDLIVREHTEYAGALVAERLGLPHAAVQISAWGGLLAESDVIAALDRLRGGLGLSPDPGLAMLHRHLTLLPCPASYPDPALPLPGTARFVQHCDFDRDLRADDGLPDWFARLPARPVVYATLGTAYNRTPGILAAILDGLCDEPIKLIVTVNHNQDPAAFGPQPPNVLIARYLPQSLVFPRCDLVVTHGGSGTVRSAIRHGLPLVVVPIAADQPENARRCAALGVARVIAADERTPAAIRAVVWAILGDLRYRARAVALQAEMLALPTPTEAVRWFERLYMETATRSAP